MQERIEIRALGGLSIEKDGKPVTGFESRKVPAILLYLAYTGRPQAREVVGELLWPERSRAQILNRLGVVLSNLRKTIDPALFLDQPKDPITLNPEIPIWLDVQTFERNITAALQSSGNGNPAQLESALALYQGDFLESYYINEADFDDWALVERERLRLQMMDASDSLIGHFLETACYRQGIHIATRVLQMDDLRERTHRLMMDLLYRSGQRVAALRQYDTLCRALESIGADPAPQTVALLEEIRQGATMPDSRPLAMQAAESPATNPYKGLYPFDEADAGVFFGREALTAQLLARLREDHLWANFLAVVGPSGSGKSSVVRAGLIPALRDGALPGSQHWCIATMMPGTQPFVELEDALLSVGQDNTLDLLTLLESGPRGLTRAVRRVLPEDPDAKLLLVIDQFEELFVLVDDENTRQLFLDSLHTALDDPHSRLCVIATLRGDFYDRPLLYTDFGELVRERTEVVLPMPPTELERAIVGPARYAGVRIESELVTMMVADVGNQPGTLPLLQHTLWELFEARADHTLTLETYRTTGGVHGAMTRRADVLFEGLTPDQQEAARQLFLRLVRLGEGTEDTRRRVPWTEVADLIDEETTMRVVVERFGQYRLLTFDQDHANGGSTVEIAHEALIREWARFRVWLDESRHDIRQQRMLATSAAAWHENRRDPSFLLHGTRLEQFATWATETTLALTEDERNYLDRSIADQQRREAIERARQQREVELARRAANRLRYLVAGMAVFLVVAVFMVAMINNALGDAQKERDKAQREAVVRQSIALAASAKEALLVNNTDLAIALALEANAVNNPPIEAQQVLAAAVYAPGTRRVLTGHEDSVNAVAISPDGRYGLSGGGASPLVIIRGADRHIPRPDQDTSVRLWDLETGQEIARFEGHTDIITDVSFSPDQKLAISASMDNTVIFWDLETGKPVRKITNDQPVNCATISHDGKYLLTGSSEQNNVKVWDTETGQLVNILLSDGASGNVWDIAFNKNNQHVIAGIGMRGFPSEGYLVEWDLTTGQMVRQITTDSTARSVAFSPDGNTILTAVYESLEGTFGMLMATSIVTLWDAQTGQELQRFVAGFNTLPSIAFSPDGRLFVSASYDQRLILWDIETGEIVHRLTGHANRIHDVEFSSDGKHLLSASEDGTLRYWDIRNGSEIYDLPTAHLSRVSNVTFSPDGQSFASGSAAREIFLWNTVDGQFVRQFQGHFKGIDSLFFSEDGHTLLSTSLDGTIRRWDVETGQELSRLMTSTNQGIWDSSVSTDGRYMLLSEAGTTMTPSNFMIYLRNLENGEVIKRFVGHTGLVTAAQISPDGRFVVSTSEDNTTRVWNFASGEKHCVLRNHGSHIFDFDFSPDSHHVLLGAADGRTFLVRVQDCQFVHILEGHSELVNEVAVSPDNNYGLTCAEDGLMILWDLIQGVEVQRFEGHFRACRRVEFSPDGRHAVSGGNEGELIFWRLFSTPEEMIGWAQNNRYIRDFTCIERERYNIVPYCGSQGLSSTRTPYPTLTASPIPSVTPTINLTEVPFTPTWTPLPSNTPDPTPTVAATSTPKPRGELTFGLPANGSISGMGDRVTREIWSFSGTAGQVISISNNNVGKTVVIYAPDGTLLTESAEFTIGPITLPETGVYSVIISTGDNGYVGRYTITINEVNP